MRLLHLPCAALTVAFAAPALAAFQISPSDRASHSYPSICRQPDGFAVAWERRAAEERDVVLQRLDDTGGAIGAIAVVNEETPGNQQLPEIACRSDGSFVVVWESRDQDGDGLGIYTRSFDASAVAVGGEIRVNATTADNQWGPRVCTADDGSAVVVWQSFSTDGAGYDILARRLDDEGNVAGDEFRANTVRDGAQITPALACARDGSFLVGWENKLAMGSQIVTAWFDTATALGGELAFAGTDAGEYQRQPALAALGERRFAVAFESRDGISIGTLRIDELPSTDLIEVHRNGRNEAPGLAVDGERIFAAWSRGAGFDYGIEGVRVDAALREPRGEVIIDEIGTNDGALATIGRGVDIATAANGDIVVWQRRDVFAPDSGSAIFVERFLDCIGDCSADGVVRVNELVTAVRIALDQLPLETCRSIDADGDGSIAINELIRAVKEALASICPVRAS
jgi:hypothetical protein